MTTPTDTLIAAPAEKRERQILRFELDHGPVIVLLPAELTPDDVNDLREWLELNLRALVRAVERETHDHTH
jgi:hypothetical protein